MPGHGVVELRFVEDVPLDQLELRLLQRRVEEALFAPSRVVVRRDLVPVGKEPVAEVAPNEPGPPVTK